MDIEKLAFNIGIVVILIAYTSLSKRATSKLPRVPLGLLTIYFFLEILIQIFSFAVVPSLIFPIEIASLIILWMGILRIVVYIVIDYFMRKRQQIAIPSIIRDFILAIVYIVIFLIVIKHKTNFNLSTLLTTSAVLTAVLGFAMQDTLGNLFAGLALQLEDPYQIGDWIGINDVVGRVVGITWKSTRVLTESEEMIFIPNNTISKSTLTNFSRPTSKHYAHVELAIKHDYPPHLVKQAINIAMSDQPKILSNPPPSIHLSKFDANLITYKAMFWTNFPLEESTKSNLLNAIWYRFKRMGIKVSSQELEDLKEKELRQRATEEQAMLTIIEKIDIFASLDSTIKKDLINKISIQQFATHETIVRQGEEPGPMYLIKEGLCSVIVLHEKGISSEVAKLHPNQFFGEMSLLTGEPRSATVKAIEDTICYQIGKAEMKELFHKHPAMLESISNVLAERQASLEENKAKTKDYLLQEDARKKQIVSIVKSIFGF